MLIFINRKFISPEAAAAHLYLFIEISSQQNLTKTEKAIKMRRNDTIDRGPNKLLLKDWDAQAYFKHKKRLQEVKPMVDFGSGKHIVHISPHGPRK